MRKCGSQPRSLYAMRHHEARVVPVLRIQLQQSNGQASVIGIHEAMLVDGFPAAIPFGLPGLLHALVSTDFSARS
jgi:hypothetical protein